MRFFHISDLHIGKRVNGFSMLEDQRWILNEIVALAGEQQPDGIWIAGDLYDKPQPSAEAVELVDDFLYQFVRLGIPVWAISGNHDSAERVAYGGRMMEQSGIHMARVFDGRLQKDTFETKAGEMADIYLLPFLRPALVRRFFPERTIETTQQAVEAILEQTELKKDRVNILIMHQFLTGAHTCESEEISVGGLEQVDASLLERFDYVALGHLHGPQKVGQEKIRYCGSPLKYSFSEAGQKKSVTVVEFPGAGADTSGTGKGVDSAAHCKKIKISAFPLKPRHDLREIRGPLAELLKPEVAGAADNRDYLHVTLTDEGEILDAIGKLREVYPNIMRLDFQRRETEEIREEEIRLEEKSPLELFGEFFRKQNGYGLSPKQETIVEQVWRKCAGEILDGPGEGRTGSVTAEINPERKAGEKAGLEAIYGKKGEEAKQ